MGLASEQSDLDIADIDWSSMLVSRRPHVRADLPYALYEFSNFFDGTVYNALAAEYPTNADAWQEVQQRMDRKIDISSNGTDFASIVAGSPIWSAWVAHVRSDAFKRDVVAFCWPALLSYLERGQIAHPGVLELVRDAPSAEVGIDRLTGVLEPNMNFSIMRPGDVNTPHSDGLHKVIALLFYMPTPDWRQEFGGRTIFYRPPEGFESLSWFKPKGNRIAEADLNTFFQDVPIGHVAAFEKNNLAMFVKATNSYHAVAPIRAPEGPLRRTFLYTLKAP